MKSKHISAIILAVAAALLIAVTTTGAICENLDRRGERAYGKAWKMEREGKQNEALEEYLKLLKKYPESPKVLERLTYIYMSKNNEEEAEKYARAAIKADENSPVSLNVMGMLCERQENLGRAEGYYLRAIGADPAYAGAHNNLGNIYMKEGRPEKAEASYLKAIELEPEKVLFYNNLAYIYELTQRNEESETFYREALKRDGQSKEALAGLQRLEEKKNAGHSETAREIAREICSFTPSANFILTGAEKSADGTITALYSFNSNQKIIVKQLAADSNFTDTIFAQMLTGHKKELLQMLEGVTESRNMKMTGQGYINCGLRQIPYVSTQSEIGGIHVEAIFSLISRKAPEKHVLITSVSNKAYSDAEAAKSFIREFCKAFYQRDLTGMIE